MSKYTELAKKANEVENIETKISASEPILKVRLEAIISSQKATVMVAKSELAVAEANVDKVRGKITVDANGWVRNLNEAKDARDRAAEEVKVAEDFLDDLEDELKLFA